MTVRRARSTLTLLAFSLPLLLRVVPAGAAPTSFAGTPLTLEGSSSFVFRDLAARSAPGTLLPPSATEDEAAEGQIPDDLFVAPGAEPQEPAATPEPEPPRPAAPPTIAASFKALDDEIASIPPDTNGAVGPSHLVAAHNNRVRIQSRTGSIVSTVTLGAFWAESGVFDPRIVYDPFAGRFVTVAVDDARAATSAILLGATASSDPTGTWTRYRYDADATNAAWCDFPTLAFHTKWIAVTCNMFAVSNNAFLRSRVVLFDRAALYAAAPSPGATGIDNTGNGGSVSPAVTFDMSVQTLHLIQPWNGNSGGNGHLRLYTVTGNVGAEILTVGPLVSVPAPWNSGISLGDFAPQLGDARLINLVDHRMQAVYRNGSLWATHPVFLPATSPTHAAVQWWEIDPTLGSLLQRGRIEDPSAVMSYGFPSIAVNATDDVLIGYSSFSANQYASANFAIRYASDPPNTLQADTLLKAGEASYYKTYGGGRNRWGDYSASMVDPLNDRDFWTVQEYAWTPTTFVPGCDSSGTRCDRWSTWWGKIVPNSSAAIIGASPSSLSLGNQRVGTTGSAQTVTISNTGTESATVGTLSVTGANASEFALTGTTCNGATLAPSSSCTASVAFSPTAGGARVATLNVPHDGPAAPTVVPLSGTGTQPGISVTPSSLSFSERVGTTSATKTVTVKDTGTEPLAIGTLTLSGPDAANFAIVTDTCSGTTLAVLATCTIGARFTPPSTGPRSATITLTHDAPGGSTQIPLSGTGAHPTISVSPTTKDFGDQAVGSFGGTTFTVTNVGSLPAVIGQVAPAGADASQFRVGTDGCSGTTLPAVGTCTFRGEFGPTSEGTKVGRFEVPFDGPTSPSVVPVSGVGVVAYPHLTLSATSIDFGSHYVSWTSTPRTLTIRNIGAASLHLGTLSLGGVHAIDFASSDPCSGATLVPGASCNVSLTFTPSGLGTRTAVLTIPSDDPATPHQVSLTGIGSGDGKITPNPTSLAFGNQIITTASGARIVTVTNTGGGPLTISSTPITGSQGPRFSIVANGCLNVPIAIGGTCQIQLTFNPQVTGSHSGTLTFTGVPNAPVVPLSGTGMDPNLTQTPTDLTFAPLKVGQISVAQRVTITNTGVGTLGAITPTLTGPNPTQFTISSACGSTLAQGASCFIDVRSYPTVSQVTLATLTLASDDRRGAKTVSLTGMGDAVAPVSSFSTPDGSILIGGVSQIRGTITDPLSGVATATLTQRHMSVLTSTSAPALSCDTPRSICVWNIIAPLTPGLYTLNVKAVDQVGNAENPGATISFIVI